MENLNDSKNVAHSQMIKMNLWEGCIHRSQPALIYLCQCLRLSLWKQLVWCLSIAYLNKYYPFSEIKGSSNDGYDVGYQSRGYDEVNNAMICNKMSCCNFCLKMH